MPNRLALSRGGEREQVVLESIRNGHSQRAACAAAGVSERSFYRHLERSRAFRHDLELGQAEAERRLVGIVLDAAATDARHAEWLLARRWPERYGDRQAIDMAARVEGQYDATILALAARYSGLSDEQAAEEVKRLSWVTGQDAGVVAARIASDSTAGEGNPDGGVTAIPSPVGTSHAAAADNGTSAGKGADMPMPPLQADSGRVVAASCPHCRSRSIPDRHEAGCPAFTTDGQVRDLAPLQGGDPR